MILLLFFAIKQSLQGFILPDKANPIVLYRNNEKAYGYYDFFMIISTRISSNGQLTIIFPPELSPTQIALNNDDVMLADSVTPDTTCPIQITQSTTTWCVPVGKFTLSARNLNIQFGTTAMNAGSIQVRVKYNQNPTGLGGKSTGFFQILTYNNGVLIDQNLSFGTVGIAPTFITHNTVADGQILNDGSNLGGYVTNYVIVFTTTVALPINSWFRAEIANGFGLGNIQCILVLTQQDLKCQVDGQRIYFGGITQQLAPGQYQIKLKSVVNPRFSGNTNHFVFETLQPFVNTVLEYYYLNTVFIQPGQIINPSIAGSPLNKNLRIDYTIKFTPQNAIPVNGKITYTFPAGYVLDNTCRIIYGLSQIGSTPITCTTSGLTITITGFNNFLSQEICLKIYATNPSVSMLYTPCKIYSFSTFGGSSYLPIDQNLNAGSIQISEIESPYFVAIDLYTLMNNLTLSQIGPLDFRLYPMPANTLTLSPSGTNFGEVYLQIPLWWRLQSQTFDGWNVYGQTPTCNFGAEVGQTCNYYLQRFQVRTPSTTNYPKYTLNLGLGQCDLPISLANVQLTPIPGRWDFRVMTFQDVAYNAYTTAPIEQDLYTMEISVDPFTNSWVRCASIDQELDENVCFASLRIGLPIPYEGAINFNMSVITDTLASSSAWPVHLGFQDALGNNLTNDTYKQIPCTVIINGAQQGYSGTLHPNIVCYIFTGGLTRLYSVIQVRGFSSVVATNSIVQIYVPGITSCKTYNQNCYITVSSAYTTEIDVPYTLNNLYQSVGFVLQGNTTKDVSVSAPANAQELQDSTLTATFNPTGICMVTTWTFTFYSPTSIQANRDYILIKMPNNRFPYSWTGASSNAGTVVLINNFLFNQLYYFITVTTTINSGNPTTVTLSNVRNSLDPSPGVVTSLIYWVSYRRQKRITFPLSANWVDGGILNPLFTILPKTPTYLAQRSDTLDTDFDSDIIFQVQFTTCHTVNVGGMIELQAQAGLTSFNSTCQTWTGVTSAQYKLGWSHSCALVTVSGQQYYQITNMNAVPPLTLIKFSYMAHTGLVSATNNAITIKTYFDAALRISDPPNAANVNDFNPSTVLGIDIVGPKRFPPSLYWQPFLDIAQIAREGTRGEFYMTVTSTYNIPSFNSNSNYKIVFTFNTTGIGMPPGGYPHCRINGNLCAYCEWVGGVITMKMPPTFSITAETPYLFMISTRGADYSASYAEGLHHILAGTYQLLIQTYDASGTQLEYIRKVFTIQPPRFQAFWVWASNKIGHDPNVVPNPMAGRTMYRIYFTNPSYIPPSNNPNPVTLVVKFYRTIPPIFTNGFEGDLGTGYAQRTDLACIHFGFTLLSNYTKPLCRLFIGSYPNPTQVLITGFAAILAGSNCQIDIPDVWNPNVTNQLTMVSLTAQMEDVITGNTIYLLQNQYQLINYTFGRTHFTTPFNQISIDVPSVNVGVLKTQYPAAVDPVFGTNVIDTLTTFAIQFGCKSHQMGGGSDMVLFELNPAWDQIPYAQVTCTSTAGGTNCVGYPGGHYLAFYPDSAIPINTLVTVTVNMKTPPFKTIVATSDPAIKIYVYTRSKLVDIWSIFFTQVLTAVLVTPTVTCTNCNWDAVDTYVFSVTNPKNIPGTGAIEIKFPAGLSPMQNGCDNDLVGGSQLSQAGFLCTLTGSSLVITGFSSFVGPNKIQVKVQMLNPPSSVAITTQQWSFNTWYLNENPFNKLITYGTTNSPALTVATQIFYWDTPYRSRVRARTTMYGTIEFRINLVNDLAAGSALMVKLPFTKIPCAQWLCIWDDQPWFDNNNDGFKLTAEKCLYVAATQILSIYTPLAQLIKKNYLWRVIIDTTNSIDGNRGFIMPAMNNYAFQIYTTAELSNRVQFVPQLKNFQFFECISLVTNVGLKNVFQIYFTPLTPADPAFPTVGIPSGGYLIMYIPTLSEEDEFLFANDLGSGISDGGAINCHPRGSFLATTTIACTLKYGNQVLGTPVQIKITGNWASLSIGFQYEVDVDQFYNPTVPLDDKHIEMRLDSFNAGGTLIEQGFSYDMTLKQFTYATASLTAPTVSTFKTYDQGTTYVIRAQSNYIVDSTLPYDYYVYEFTKPNYGSQPLNAYATFGGSTTVQTSKVMQGHNWIIIKPDANIGTSLVTLNIKNVNNPTQMPYDTTQTPPQPQIPTVGYAIKDRIVTAIYTYAVITTITVTQITATGNQFLVAPVDFPTGEVPSNTIMKFLVTINIGTSIASLPAGSVIDMWVPATYTAVFGNCYDNQFKGSLLKFTKNDNLNCQVSTGTYSTYSGRKQITLTGWDTVNQNEQMIVEIWAQTGAALVPAPTATPCTGCWELIAWTDNTRKIQLLTGYTPSPEVKSFKSLPEFSWKIKNPATIRANNYGPFEFDVMLKTAASSTSVLQITFPSTVQVPTGAFLTCTITDTSGNVYKFSYCTFTGTLIVSMLFPIQPTTYAVSTWWKIKIDSRGYLNKHGLLFTSSGLFSAALTIGSDTGSVNYEVLPSAAFQSPNIQIVHSYQSYSTAFLVSFQTTQQILADGSIVLAFPQQLISSGTVVFNNDLSSVAQIQGGVYQSCYTSTTILRVQYLNCRIYQTKGLVPQTSVVITGFASNIPPYTTLNFALENIQVLYDAAAAAIPLLLYSANSAQVKLEAQIFPDWLSPVPTTAGFGSGNTIGIIFTANSVQASTTIQFQTVNTGTTGLTPTSYIAFQFPQGLFNLAGITIHSSTSTACSSNSALTVIAHWVILVQSVTPSPACSGNQNFYFTGFNNMYSAQSSLTFSTFVCFTRACTYVGTKVLTGLLPVAISGSTPTVNTAITQSAIQPFNSYIIDMTLPMNAILPSSTQIIISHPASNMTIQRIMLTNGVSKVTIQKLNATFFAVTLLSDFTGTSLLFKIWANFPGTIPNPNIPMYSITFYTRYMGGQVQLDSIAPNLAPVIPIGVTSTTYTTQQSFLHSAIIYPGIVGVQNYLELHIPAISTISSGPLPGNYYSMIVYIDGATLYPSGSCTVSIVQFPSTFPICVVSSTGIISVTQLSVPPGNYLLDPYNLQISPLTFTTAGAKAVTVQIFDDSNTQRACFYYFVTVFPQQFSSFSKSFMTYSNYQQNIFSATFQLPASMDGSTGYVFLDLLHPVSTPTASRQIGCYMTPSTNMNCLFVPASKLSSSTTSSVYQPYQDSYFDRILMWGFPNQGSATSVTINVYFPIAFQIQYPYVFRRYFTLGYFSSGTANYENYQFGQSFYHDFANSYPLTTNFASLIQTGQTISVTGATESLQSITIQFPLTTIFNIGDYFQVKLQCGYHLADGFVDKMSTIQAVTIGSVGFSLTSNVMWNIGFFEFQSTGGSGSVIINNLQMPYIQNSSCTKIATIVQTNSARNITNIFQYTQASTVSAATLTSCTAQQLSDYLFTVSFTLPTGTSWFNDPLCDPSLAQTSGGCKQGIRILPYSDISQFEITCGLGTSITYLSTNTFMTMLTGSGYFTMYGYSTINANAPICITFRKKALATAATPQTFTIQIVETSGSDQILASCTATADVGSNGPVILQGAIRTQFGFMDYFDEYTNIAKNSQGYLVFALTVPSTLSSAGYFNIYTTSLSLSSWVVTNKLKCFFRKVSTSTDIYAATYCNVNPTNQLIQVVYTPPAAANQLTTGQLYEFVIRFEQQTNPFLNLQTTSGKAQFIIRYYVGACCAVVLPTYINVLYAEVYNSESSAVYAQTFSDNSGQANNFQVSFTTQNAITSDQYIEIQFPVTLLTNVAAQKSYYPVDLGTGIKNGYKINCLSKNANLGTNYKCNLFYGLTSLQNLYAYVRLSGFPNINSGTAIKFNIMNFINPTSGLIMNFALKIASDSGVYSEYTVMRKIQYVLPTYSTAASTLGTLTLTPLNAATLINYGYSVTVASAIDTNQQGIMLINFNSVLFNGDFSAFTATVGGSAAQIDPLDSANVFVTIPANYSASSNIAIQITAGLWNPVYYTTISQVVNAKFISYHTKNILQFNTATLSVTNTQTNIATIGTITSNTNLQNDPLALFTIPLTLLNQLKIGYQIKINIPASYKFTSGQYCQLFNSATSIPYSITYTFVDAQNIKFILNSNIPTTTVLNLQVQLQLPASTTSGNIVLDFYADSTTSLPIQTITQPSITMSTFTKLWCALPTLKSPQYLLQDWEFGPIRLTSVVTAAFPMTWSYTRIDYTKWITQTIFWPTPAPTGGVYQVRCFWNNLAATWCRHDLTNSYIQVWAPSSTSFAVNDQYTLFISLWRNKPMGEEDFQYGWHTNSTLLYTASKLTAVPLVFYSQAAATLFTVTKNIATQNYRFDNSTTVALTPNWAQPYITVYQTTISNATFKSYSAIQLRFRLRKDLPSYLGTSWGQLILNIPTMDDWDTAQSQVDDGIGRFQKNGQQVDCICNSCPSYPVDPSDPYAPLFQCFVYLGYHNRVAPVKIWINPQYNLLAGDLIDITIAKIRMPTTQYTYGKLSLLAYEYVSSTKQYLNHSEIVHGFTYQSIPDNAPQYTGVTPPTWSPNFVGQPGQATWTVNNPYADIQASCQDRWVLASDDNDMIFEHPYNPKGGAGTTLTNWDALHPYNFIFLTTATSHLVTIFPIAKWATFQPTTVQTKSATQSILIKDFKNMPFKMQYGVNYTMTLFIEFGIRSKTIFDAYPTATESPIVLQSVDPIPTTVECLQPNQFVLKFLPYNKIPVGGVIQIFFPNYDWTYTDAYCKVSSNLADASCDIIPGTYPGSVGEIIVQAWTNYYVPRIDGVISVTFDIVNPSSPQPSIIFNWQSYWNNTYASIGSTFGLIDKNPSFQTPANQIVLGGALRVQLWTVYQHPYIICGGRIGPLRLIFSIRDGPLVYPTDYVRLQFQYAFTPSMPANRIVCYFNSLTDFDLAMIKSHRCDWTAGGGGTLIVYIPEEIDIKPNVQWELVITTFASLGRDGWYIASPSQNYWMIFDTFSASITTMDKGWFQAWIPGCPFDQTTFYCENVGWEASTVGGDPSWTIFNMSASTVSNLIPTGDPNQLGSSRLLFEFPTHNELAQSWPQDLTNRMSGAQWAAQVACNGLISGGTKPLQPQGATYITCQNILAGGNAWNNTPSYIMAQYYASINVGSIFNFQIADFSNGYVQGQFQHIKISVQVMLPDGQYYNQNEHYCWHSPHSLLPPPAPATSCSPTNIPYQTQVNLRQVWTWFTTNVGSVLNLYDVVVFDYSYPYTFPLKGFCQQKHIMANYTDGPEVPCTPQHYNGWFVFGVTLNKSAWDVRESGNLQNPPFVMHHANPQPEIFNPGWNNFGNLVLSSQISTYVWQAHQLVCNTTSLNKMQSPTTGRAWIVLQTTSAQNPADQYITYHIGIMLQTYTSVMKHIRIWASNDFQDIKNCKINRGLTVKDQTNLGNAITCTITHQLRAPNLGWLIEIDNYATYQGDGWIIVDLDLKNPNAQKWTSTWWIKTFESVTNLTYVSDESKAQDGQTWVGETIKAPNFYRVYRNTVSYENRRAKTDQYAEVHMRILPRLGPYPATTDTSNTDISIWLPISYDIANGGQPVCQVSNNYHTDLQASTCSLNSDRTIDLQSDPVVGMHQPCSLVTVTTVNAIGGNGVLLPSTPSSDQFQVFMDSTATDGTVKREYNYNSAAAAPQVITLATDPNFYFYSTIRECSQRTVIKIRFTAPLDIPAGYNTAQPGVDPLSAPPIGSILYKFNTQDLVNNGWPGFPLNLGQATNNVLCQAFSNITGNIVCTMTASPSQSVNYPVTILLSGFDYIMNGTVIEIHFLDILNGNCGSQSYYNNGQVQLTAYRTEATGTVVSMIKDSTGYVPFLNDYLLSLQYVLVTTCPVYPPPVPPPPPITVPPTPPTPTPPPNVILDPWQVGAYIKLTLTNLPINCTLTSLGPGDSIVLRFPSSFQFPSESNGAISGVWNNIQMITVIYPAMGDIYFTFPSTAPAQGGCTTVFTLIVSQLRGPAYAFTTNWQLRYTVIHNQYRIVECYITSLPPPAVAPASTAALAMTSTFAGDVNVNYNFTFSPSYIVPAGSNVTIQLPTGASLNYNQLLSSNPPAICSSINSDLMGSCTMTTTSLKFTTLKQISSQTPLSIQLTGAKNPQYVGLTSNTDYQLQIVNPAGFFINQNNFAPFQFYYQKVVGVVYMQMSNTNNFQNVSADYTFVMQSTNQVPLSGQLVLKMPIAWAQAVTVSFSIAQLTASWTSESLTYSYSVDKVSDTDNYLLIIKNQFVWPAGGSLNLLMLKLTNPTFAQTQIFQFITYYDSVALDQTDPIDTSLRFNYQTSVPAMPVSDFKMQPQNSGEVSTYSMTMNSSTGLSVNSTIQLQFPSTYPSQLTRYDLSLQCTLTFSNGTNMTLPCTAANQRLVVNCSTAIPANVSFIVSVSGIVNPNSGAVNGAINVITADPNNNILTYTSNAANIVPSAAPKTLELTSLSTTSTNLQVRANYTFCVTTVNPIPVTAQVFIDFPLQFNLRSTSYPCFIASNHNNVLLPYNNATGSPSCQNTNTLRRIAVGGQTAAYSGDATNPATLCYLVNNVENPQSGGPTKNFVVSIYDTNTSQVLYSTFGTLSANSTLSYSQQGLVITVDNIDPLPRYLSTPLIAVTLQRSVSHVITLTPQSTEFKFTPASLVFQPSNGPVMYFKIQAINDTNTLVGTKSFSWKKVENTTSEVFSQMADTYFQYIDTPLANTLIMTIFPLVYRVALGGTSLPMTLTLSQPASQNLTVNYITVKPYQEDYYTFTPTTIVFPAGTVTQQLSYTTKTGARSGQIQFSIVGTYANTYTIANNIVNVEILQLDDKPPIVIDYKAWTIGRTTMYFRAIIDESVQLYYTVALRGNPVPTMDQIKNKTILTNVFQTFGTNSSYVSPVTTSYIYYDVYLDVTGLTEATDYTLSFFVTDLSGNNNSQVCNYNFTTLPKYQPAQFSLTLTDNVDLTKLISSLGLVTGLPASRFKIVSSPAKFTINDTDADVQKILADQTVTYTIEILPDPNTEEQSPKEYVRSIQKNLALLVQEVPQVVATQNVFQTVFEVFQWPQKYTYNPKLLNKTSQSASFQASIKYSGKLYTLVLPVDQPQPTNIQIKAGLNSTNMKVSNTSYYRFTFKYDNTTSTDNQKLDAIFTFTMLLDNRNYTAYFTGENYRSDSTPDLMANNETYSISFKTDREVIIIPESYVYGAILQIILIILI